MRYEMKLTSLEPKRWWHKIFGVKRKKVEFKGFSFDQTADIRLNFMGDINDEILVQDVCITEIFDPYKKEN